MEDIKEGDLIRLHVEDEDGVEHATDVVVGKPVDIMGLAAIVITDHDACGDCGYSHERVLLRRWIDNDQVRVEVLERA